MTDDYHKYYDYLTDFDVYGVVSMFQQQEKPWTTRINADSYWKALRDFTKHGELMNFPGQKVYQWMGIIMRNTAILRTLTSIAGHDYGYPTYELIDSFFYDDPDGFEQYKESIGISDDNDALCELLEEKEFFEWFQLPDGSDPWSDYGIRPLEEIIMEYNDDLSPEEVLVLVNRCLDVTHCRGDLSSIFITGGPESLDRISEEMNVVKIIDEVSQKIFESMR